MKTITFYLDFISPYAYLAFEKLPEALTGCSYEVRYQPVLFGALLQHHGQLGPAEMAPKRDWTYRQVLWLAKQHGVSLRMPLSHPFNPVGLLRLALAAASSSGVSKPQLDGLPNRWICEQIFRHVWQSGADATDPERLQTLGEQLQLSQDPNSPAVKEHLRQLTTQAIEAQVFGVPSFAVDDKLFWGFDALPMLRAYLQADPWFEAGDWQSVAQVAVGIQRKP